jgi:general secretion pathway protein G
MSQRFALPHFGRALAARDSRVPGGEGRSRGARRSGFTAVELAVAIAIVSLLATVALGSYQRYRERIQIADAITRIGATSALVNQYRSDHGVLPPDLAAVGLGAMLDPWGNAYEYVNHEDTNGKGKWRKDHNIVPINSDYDLWSKGKDGNTVAPLTAAASRDDIVRANDGRFIGLASQYDP